MVVHTDGVYSAFTSSGKKTIKSYCKNSEEAFIKSLNSISEKIKSSQFGNLMAKFYYVTFQGRNNPKEPKEDQFGNVDEDLHNQLKSLFYYW